MLKRTIIFGLIVFCFCSNVLANSDYEVSDLETKTYYIDLRQENITTSNIGSVFKNFKILKIYPAVSLSINDSRITNSLLNLNFTDADSYVNNYVNILKKFGFYDDSEMVLINGVKIDTVYVEVSKNQLNKLLLEHKNVKIVKRAITEKSLY